MGRPPVAGGAHLAGVAAEPGEVPGGVFGADISFGSEHGVSFGHASQHPIRTNPLMTVTVLSRQSVAVNSICLHINTMYP
jgi:hypothetical protein